MSNTPKITAEERVYNDRLAKQEKWLSVVIGEDGERHYLANRDFWHGTFTTLRHKAQRYVSEDVALKKAREMQESERPNKPVSTPRAERLHHPWIADIDAERVN